MAIVRDAHDVRPPRGVPRRRRDEAPRQVDQRYARDERHVAKAAVGAYEDVLLTVDRAVTEAVGDAPRLRLLYMGPRRAAVESLKDP